MFALTENMRYYLYQHYVDMRKGMTGLYQLVKSDMSLLPFQEMFLFSFPTNGTWLKFYVGIRMVLFFTRSAWKKVPSSPAF